MFLSIEDLKHKLQQPLPGIKSHLKMAPNRVTNELSGINEKLETARKSAVLILLFPEDGNLKTVLIKRSEYEGIHSGQISFPGGKKEDIDQNFEATALRETLEEIGVESSKIEILGQLTDFYISPSNFLVKVFVGYSSQRPDFIKDSKEVQTVLIIDLEEFFRGNIIHEKEFNSTSRVLKINAPYFKINDIEIWGATAMILSELLDVLNDK
jgi:8-oxo-dGTP pyrophosphatase MutT (NUDIX family)